MRLTLFFTRGVSLQIWVQRGMFEREIAIYQRLRQEGIEVGFVTYGDRRDLDLTSRMPGIKILCNRWHLPLSRYQRWLHLLHAPWLWRSDMIKTNQTPGADIALHTARFWRKPLIARCGYMWSEFVANKQGADAQATHHAQAIESQVFSAAQQVIVTTPMMADDIKHRIPAAASRTVVIPNYVETDRFLPLNHAEYDFDLIFIGRLVLQKNVSSLLEAIAPLKARLIIIGSGELQEPLKQKFAHLSDRICWQGNVSNAELPSYLNRACLFILPSYYEGHPKVLIEAMSCGMPVIGAKSPGIQELIQHGENGWLCNTDPESIRTAVEHLLAQPDLRTKLGRNARQFVLENFALDEIVYKERALYKKLLFFEHEQSN